MTDQTGNAAVSTGQISERNLVETSLVGKHWSRYIYKSAFAILQVCRRFV